MTMISSTGHTQWYGKRRARFMQISTGLPKQDTRYIIVIHLNSSRHATTAECKGMGHLGNDEAMEAGDREFDPRPGHYSRMSF